MNAKMILIGVQMTLTMLRSSLGKPKSFVRYTSVTLLFIAQEDLIMRQKKKNLCR